MAGKQVQIIKLEGRNGTIRLSNVPPNIIPKLLPITDEQEAAWLGLDKDRIGIVTSIAANLVFHDRKGNEVNYFSSPITLSYRFGPEDEKKRKGREVELKGKSGKRRAVELVPIFLYQYILDKNLDTKPKFEIWQPFQHFNFNKQTRTVTIKFRFWGDQPIGGGTQP